MNLTLSHPQEESTDDRKRKTRTTPYFHEVWDLEEIEAFENARKKHGDDFDSLCKAVSSRKRSEIRKLWNQYKKAYPLDAKGNPIEFDESSDEEENESLNIPHISESASEDEEAEEEEVEEEEESEEEPQPPPKKTKRPVWFIREYVVFCTHASSETQEGA